MKKVLFAAILVLLLQGCITRPWEPTPQDRQEVREQNMSMIMPDGWMKSNTTDVLLLTRDGMNLEYIMVETIHVEDKLKHTKKRFVQGMTALEQAEVILDNMASNPDFLGFKTTSNKPSSVAGHNGFRAEFTFKDADNLAYRGTLYGFMQNSWFYGVFYVGTDRYYYEHYLPEFEAMVKTVKLLI